MSFDCLAKDTNIWGPHFLEASAGTGKTFAIEHVFVRHILQAPENSPIFVDDILVVTFTRASTRDLKLRIRANLERAIEFIQLGVDQWQYLVGIKDKQAAIQRLQDALYNFDRLQVFTIHGFCQRALLEFSLQAGIYLENEDKDQPQGKTLVLNQIEEYFRYDIHDAKFAPFEISCLIKESKGVQKLIRNLYQKISSPSREETTLEHLFDSFIDSIQSFSSVQYSEIEHDFEKLASCYKKLRNFDTTNCLAQLKEIVDLIHRPNITSFADLLSTNCKVVEFLSEKNRKKQASIPSGNQLKASAFFEWLEYRFQLLVKQALSVDRIEALLLLDLKKHLEKKREEQAFLTPDELLFKMNESLAKSDFLSLVAQKYQVIIIDEFQDTDPIQWEIFEKIYQNGLVSFYLVGDPKQSIYAFRNADLYTYLRAAETLGDNHLHYLDTNYRSSKVLVDTLNELFSTSCVQPWLHLPKLEKILNYRKVHPGNTEEQNKDPAIYFFTATGKSGRSRWPTNDLQKECLFPFISAELQKLHSKRTRYQDCAVLVKDRFQAKQLRDFLSKEQIPSRLISRFSIADTDMFFAIRDLLEAAYHPKSRNRIKRALLTPIFGYSISDLSLFKEELPDLLYSEFQYLSQVLYVDGISAFFQALLRFELPEEGVTVLEHISKYEDQAYYSNFFQIIEHLISKEQEKRLTKESIFKVLDSLKSADPEENEEVKLRMDTDQDAVQIYTIHMSKGLEFEVVFALGVSCRSSQGKRVSEEDLAEINAEKLRQFYVAMTRAKSRLYIPFIEDQAKPKGLLEKASQIELFFSHITSHVPTEDSLQALCLEQIQNKLEPLTEQNKIVWLDAIAKNGTEQQVKRSAIDLKFSDIKIKTMPHGIVESFTQLSQKGISKDIEHTKLVLPKNMSIHSLPAGAETGVFLHNILEEAFSFHHLDIEKIVHSISAKIPDSLLPWKAVIEKNICEVLNLELVTQDGKVKLSDLCLSNVQTEVEFYMCTDKGTQNRIKGFIDLLFIYKGKYYLVDWKSNWLGEDESYYSEESLCSAMKSHDYFLQGSIYSNAIEKILSQGRDFQKPIVGGMFYIFLRGVAQSQTKGVYFFKPQPISLS